MSETLLRELGLPRFRPRAPWWGADLQTLRDTLRSSPHEETQAELLRFPVGAGASLLGLLEQPLQGAPRALVLVIHGLGASSDSEGPRRLALALRRQGFSVLRLNLRGAGRGRALAPGSYAADCSGDLLPVLRQLRDLATRLANGGPPLPLAGAGISLGGTILLNAAATARRQGEAGLDALACISSPLDLHSCTRQFARPRNRLYERWLVDRLCRQVLADPQPLGTMERQALQGGRRPRTILQFDALITAPRWGFDSVESYHAAASPLSWLDDGPALSPTLLVHALDDPWVPAGPARALADRGSGSAPEWLEICLSEQGGHNGFHSRGDSPLGCWSDRLTACWLDQRLSSPGNSAAPPNGS